MAETPAADTVLAVDFGTATTRALLFDVVESAYRLVGYGEAPTTVAPPYRDASEGMRHALADLQAATGRALLDDNSRLILPANAAGRGADLVVFTHSVGPPVRTVMVGLLPDVSLASAQRLVAGQYISVVDSFSLGDTRSEDRQIDAALAARPDLFVISGGTDSGASDALLKLTETVGLVCHLLPDARPRVLFVGNPALQARLSAMLARVAVVHSAPNVRPELGSEQLGPAAAELGRLLEEMRLEQLGGLLELAQATAGRLAPTAQAAGILARYLSKLPAWPRGVLAVDVGSANTSLAAAWRGEGVVSVQAGVGIGAGAAALADGSLERMTAWVPREVGEAEMRAFVLNKSVHPQTLPGDLDDLYLEHALVREALRLGLRRARAGWPERLPGPRHDLLPWFSLIVGSGAALAVVPRPGVGAMLLLDALQPAGLTRLWLDPYHLTAALGAVALYNPLVTAQVVDSLAFVDLGISVSVLGRGRTGDVALTVKLAEDGGPTTEAEIKFGDLAFLPLAVGRQARLSLRPRPTVNVGFGLGRARALTIAGGAAGVIVDARGRPLPLPRAPEARYEALKGWTWRAMGN